MQLTIEEALRKGVDAHKAGKIQEADQMYTAILKNQPQHADANHNMGILAVGIDKIKPALDYFKRAIKSNPNVHQYWLSFIDALIRLERFEEATEIIAGASSQF